MRRSAAIAIILVLILVSCVSGGLPISGEMGADTPIPSALRPSGTSTAVPDSAAQSIETSTPIPATATLAITPTVLPPTPTAVSEACLTPTGKVEVNEITTDLLPDPLMYRIYLPPCYDTATRTSYPVLYLMHGQSYTDSQWDDLGVPETADRLIAAGDAAPFIVVMPRDRVWKEPTEDNFGKAVEQVLIPWVDEHYRTIPDRAHRAVGGLSRGGAWAVELGFSHWELFGAVGVHSGFVFHSDAQAVKDWLNSIPEGMIPRIYLDLGNGDRAEISDAAIALENLLTSSGIPHEWHLFVGEHQDAYWGAHVEDYLRFYTREWGN